MAMNPHAQLERLMARYLELPTDERVPYVRSQIGRHPEFTEHLAEMHVETVDPTGDHPHPDDDDIASLAVAMFRRLRGQVSETPPVPSLLARAKELGIAPPRLAAELRLGLDLVMKLDRRLILSDTIPAALFDRLAVMLQTGVAQVTSALGAAPVQRAAFYSAKQPPKAQEPESFGAALARSPSMSVIDRQYWQAQQ